MGSEVARKDSVDSVYSPDGTGKNCMNPTTQSTQMGSSDVFVNGTGAVRQGDNMKVHAGPGCPPHAPPLTSFSSTVFVNGKGIGRKGDKYGGNHTILTGSSNVFAGD
jgi:uncharacterized Zn-binding protein involved in type VI secretion